VNLVARPWINYKDRVGIQADVTEQVKLRFDDEGISLPNPQLDVHLFPVD
jgi:small conductance mechanosensitive channel